MSFHVGAGALGALPVFLVDVFACVFLLRVWRRAPGDPFGALPLALFFAGLGGLALVQTVMMSLDDKWASWIANHVGQSLCVLSTAPAVTAFAHRFTGVTFEREMRISVSACAFCVFAVAVIVVVDANTATDVDIFYDYAHQRAHRRPHTPDINFLTPTTLLGWYAYAFVVLLRKQRRLDGRRRTSARAFAVVILLAIGGVAMQRLENAINAVPFGTYSTYMLWVTLAALLLFATHTDEITRFHDRVAALVVVAVLAPAAVISQQAVTRVSTEGLSPADARVVVDDVAFPAALIMLAATALCFVVVPTLAELSVLRPLRRLERAEADSRSKSVFLAAMSHELKTPLHAILHHARALATQEALTSTITPPSERATVIASSAQHLLAMIEALLIAGRQDSGALVQELHPEDVRVVTVVNDTLALHRPGLRAKGLSLTVEVDGALRVRLDRRLLTQVLSNLVGNAVKYGRAHLRITATHATGRLRVVVKDGGDGVPKDVRDKIFQPFFQVKPTEGAGLGLAISRQLCEAMHGSLTLDDDSAFVVDIEAPLAQEKEQESQEAPAASSSTPAEALSLSDDVRAALLELCKNGDIAALTQKTQELKQDPSTSAAASAIEPLLQRFQLRLLRKMLGDES